jgi:5-methylcytosine-specific restriction protein A
VSNRRKPPLINLYRSEFLRSRAWFARRDRWFGEQSARGIPLTCTGCGRSASKRELELHHLDYAGVIVQQGRWKAAEPHNDLVPMHPYCHDLLHRLIDRDAVLSANRSRRAASQFALERLRRKFQPIEGNVP